MNLQDFKALLIIKEKSGQNIAQFCKSQNIKSYTFYYWLKRIKSRENPKPSSFVELQAPLPDFNSKTILELPNGFKVHFTGMDAIARLKTCIHMLEN